MCFLFLFVALDEFPINGPLIKHLRCSPSNVININFMVSVHTIDSLFFSVHPKYN